MPKRPTSCVYCGGPLPPPALTGRPRSFCSAQCRQANERVVVSRNLHEKERRERERLEAEATARREKLEAEVAARDEREYRRAIEAGGDAAAEAKWQRLFDKTSEKGRWSLCQWPLANGEPGACTNRTADVYCAKHNRQLDRESEQQRRRRSEL
jgi:hypothetical protein